MEKNKITLLVGSLLFVALIAGVGCASKGFVRDEVAALDQKVEGVETSVEENQTRIKEHDERLATLGSLVKEQETKLDSQRTEFDSRIDEVKKAAEGKLIFQETLRNEQAKFQFDSYELSDEAKISLDAFVRKLVEENRGVYLEIQGHTEQRSFACFYLE